MFIKAISLKNCIIFTISYNCIFVLLCIYYKIKYLANWYCLAEIEKQTTCENIEFFFFFKLLYNTDILKYYFCIPIGQVY